MKVVYISRRRNSIFYSIERVFDLVAQSLPDNYKSYVLQLPKKGVSFNNLLFVIKRTISLDKKQYIFHITGDAHYVALSLLRNKTVLTIHDCGFMKEYTGLKKWMLKKILLEWPVNYLRHITTISEKTKEEILRYTKCHPDKITVIPNPVSEGIGYTEKLFNTERPQILFIGLTPNKNLERAALAIKDIPCTLRVIGDLSPMQKQLLIEKLIDFSSIYGISEQELNEEYRQSDIVLFPSLYEGFGLPIIEGQKAGRVVITSDLSPMKEVAGGGACLINPYSEISIKEGLLKVIQSESYRNELIRKGFTNSEQFSPQKIANQYLNLYKRIANKGNVHNKL